MHKPVADEPSVQVELSVSVLQRLLRERTLVASELRYLNNHSSRAARDALLAALKPANKARYRNENGAKAGGHGHGAHSPCVFGTHQGWG